MKTSAIVALVTLLLSLSIVTPIKGQEAEREELKFNFINMDRGVLSYTGQLFPIYLEDIGIKLDVTTLASSGVTAALYNQEYEICLYALPSPRDYPLNLFNMYGEYDRVPGGARSNNCAFHNATVDTLLDQLRATRDSAEQRDIVFEIEEIYAEELPWLNTCLQYGNDLIRKEYTGYVVRTGGALQSRNRWTFVNLRRVDMEYGGTFIQTREVAGSLNPTRVPKETDNVAICKIYDTLFTYASPEPGKIRVFDPWLADDWWESDGGLTYGFHIREGAKWHDGEPLTSEDVAFTFTYLKEKQTDFYEYLEKVESVETAGPYTVLVHLSEPVLWFLESLVDIPIIPKHIWEGREPTEDDPNHIGSGPFMFSRWEKGEYFEVVKNPNFWMVGKPHLDSYGVKEYVTRDAWLLAVVTNEAQGAGVVDPALAIEAQKNPDIQVVQSLSTSAPTIFINNRVEFLDDKRVRQAMNYAIDRDDLNVSVFEGFGLPCYDAIGDEYYCPYYYNPDVEKATYNVTKANAILDEAGYLDIDGDGIREVPGAPSPTTPGFPWEWVAAAAVVIVIAGGASAYWIMRRRKR